MRLSDKQAIFTRRIGVLISIINEINLNGVRYRVRDGYSYRGDKCNAAIGGHPKSTHINRLARDFIIDKSADGAKWTWVKESDDPIYTYAHDLWDKMGGAKRIDNDLNHFSFEYGGIR